MEVKKEIIRMYHVSFEELLEDYKLIGRIRNVDVQDNSIVIMAVEGEIEEEDGAEEKGKVHVVEMEGEANEGHYCFSKIAGTSFRKDIPWDNLKSGQLLILEREPDNEHDKNAIKISIKMGPRGEDVYHLGYINRDLAVTLANIMDDGKLTFYAKITDITGGTKDKENRGINIDIWYKKVKK